MKHPRFTDETTAASELGRTGGRSKEVLDEELREVTMRENVAALNKVAGWRSLYRRIRYRTPI